MGYELALLGRDKCKLEKVGFEVQEESGVNTLVLTCNISESKQVETAYNECLKTSAGINVLVNGAGGFDWNSAVEADLTVWENLIRVNLTAAMHITRLALPQIIQQREGAVIFIASLAAKYSFGMNAAYVASKHGLLGFAGSVFEDVRNYNIKVYTICPGNVKAGASLVLKRIGMN